MTSSAGQNRSIPITVLGGYLGAGKTTLLNQLLRHGVGSRLGVVVNDFGEMGIDARLLDGEGDAPVLNLANGCVCCTLGDDLRETLAMLAAIDPPLDHIVVEASGVADPAATAAWGTVPPFVPGGVVVLAAADSIRRQVTDRYVGGEVMRQLQGADLIVLTKLDVCSDAEREACRRWLADTVTVPVVESTFGDVSPEIVLDPNLAADDEHGIALDGHPVGPHHDAATYARWQWACPGSVSAAAVRSFVENLPIGLLRLKGFVSTGGALRGDGDGRTTPATLLVQVVGTSWSVTPTSRVVAESALSAIGVVGVLDTSALDDLVERYF